MALPEPVVHALRVLKKHAQIELHEDDLHDLTVELNRLLIWMEEQAAKLEVKDRVN